tara:strand:+ start:1550 stop:1912 length:363 start_codon:yes stop_codon:yes gene_type:complete
MKVSLKQCLNIQAGLVALSESKMLDLKNAFVVAQNMRTLEPVIESFNSVREDFVAKLREKADENDEVATEEVEKVNKAINEALEEKHNLGLKKLNLSSMQEIDVPAKVISQILDIAEYDG